MSPRLVILMSGSNASRETEKRRFDATWLVPSLSEGKREHTEQPVVRKDRVDTKHGYNA